MYIPNKHISVLQVKFQEEEELFIVFGSIDLYEFYDLQ